jgi:hypothetical protein
VPGWTRFSACEFGIPCGASLAAWEGEMARLSLQGSLGGMPVALVPVATRRPGDGAWIEHEKGPWWSTMKKKSGPKGTAKQATKKLTSEDLKAVAGGGAALSKGIKLGVEGAKTINRTQGIMDVSGNIQHGIQSAGGGPNQKPSSLPRYNPSGQSTSEPQSRTQIGAIFGIKK